MISKKLIDYVAGRKGIENKELVEKDLVLHSLLCSLANNDSFRQNYALKGGTCLIKCYLGYYRFSEDLDFTWIKQETFKNKTETQIRKLLSTEINSLLALIEKVAAGLGIDFKPAKVDKRYVGFGGGNKFLTCKLWYLSVETGIEQFVKIQVNYVEDLKFALRQLKAQSLIVQDKEISFLFPENKEILTAPIVTAYDIKEILVEKMRAIITRQGVKARDFIDIYVICKHQKLQLEEFEHEIIDKTAAMMRYSKYLRNMVAKAKEPPMFSIGEEKRILLLPLDSDFEQFAKEISQLAQMLISKILQTGGK